MRRGCTGNDPQDIDEGNRMRTEDIRQDDTASEAVDAVRRMLANPRRTRR